MGKVEALIHVGTYKTGTSSIQNLLWENRTALIQNKVLYPKSGLLLTEPDVGVRHSELCHAHVDRHVWDGMCQAITSELFTSQCEKIIISCESWSRGSKRMMSSLYDLASYLTRQEMNVDILCFLRNLPEYSISVYREMVRRRGCKLNYEDFFRENFEVFDYDSLTSHLVQACPTHFVPFDSTGPDPQLHFGLPEQFKFTERHNQSLDGLTIEIMRILNSEYPYWRDIDSTRLSTFFKAAKQQVCGCNETLTFAEYMPLRTQFMFRQNIGDICRRTGFSATTVARLLDANVFDTGSGKLWIDRRVSLDIERVVASTFLDVVNTLDTNTTGQST